MSNSSSIPIVTAPILLPLIIAGAAVAATGAVFHAMSKAMSEGCKEVYKMCKDGNYPLERIQMVHTPISNYSGLQDMLKQQGYHLSQSTSELRNAGMPDFKSSMHNIKNPSFPSGHFLSIATNKRGESMFLLHSDSGIGLIGQNVDRLQSTVQDFATQEITTALRKNDFKVTIEEKGAEKIITAIDRQKNQVDISLKKGTENIVVDTRKTRRPKCDFIHQVIQEELHKNKKWDSRADTQELKRSREDQHIKIRS